MAIFGVITKSDKIVSNTISDIEMKLEDNNIIRNPFKGGIKTIDVNGNRDIETCYILYIEPLYPNFTIYIWVVVFAWLYIGGWSNWILIPGVIASLGIFWSKYFYYFVLRLSLRKNGYKDKIKLVSNTKLLKKIVFEV